MDNSSYAKFTPRIVCDRARAEIARIKALRLKNAAAHYISKIPDWNKIVTEKNKGNIFQRIAGRIFDMQPLPQHNYFNFTYSEGMDYETAKQEILDEARRMTREILFPGADHVWMHEDEAVQIGYNFITDGAAVETCEKLITLATNTKEKEILVSKEDAAIIFN